MAYPETYRKGPAAVSEVKLDVHYIMGERDKSTAIDRIRTYFTTAQTLLFLAIIIDRVTPSGNANMHGIMDVIIYAAPIQIAVGNTLMSPAYVKCHIF